MKFPCFLSLVTSGPEQSSTGKSKLLKIISWLLQPFSTGILLMKKEIKMNKVCYKMSDSQGLEREMETQHILLFIIPEWSFLEYDGFEPYTLIQKTKFIMEKCKALQFPCSHSEVLHLAQTVWTDCRTQGRIQRVS